MVKYIVVLGALINFSFSLTYVYKVIKGTVKPNRVTWFIWMLAPFIATAAAFSKGPSLSILTIFVSGLAPLLVFIFSFINKKAYWKLTFLDFSCGISSILALIFWYFTKNPAYAIMFSILSECLAGLPTLIKSWKFPETENSIAFIGGLISVFSSFFAIKTFDFTSMGYQI